MKCDLIHSKIEKKAKFVPVYSYPQEFFTLNFSGVAFAGFAIQRSSHQGRPKAVSFTKTYTTKLFTNEAKKKDLQRMCEDITILRAYHNFYNSLRTGSEVRDNLSEPDVDEDTDTDGDQHEEIHYALEDIF